MSKRIAVIGAGLAGLAAAWRLVERGQEVVVYERRPVPGGLLATVERGGIRADTGTQLLASTYHATFALARAAGLNDLLVRSSGRDALWRRGRSHGITYGSVASMAASAALPALLKLKLAGKYVPWLSSRAAHLDVNDLAGTAVGEDRESIAAWGRRELGEDFVEYLTYPLLAAYYGTPPELASAALYHALARVGLHVTVHAVRGGAAAFPAALASALEGRGVQFSFGAQVEAVTGDPARPSVVVAGRQEEPFDAVVIATPPAAAIPLVPVPAVQVWLEAVPTRTAVSVVLWVRRRARSHSFGYSFPRLEPPGDVVVAACVQSRKLDFGDVPGDAVVAFPAPAFMDRDPSDAELAAAVPRALERALPGINRVLDAVEVYRVDGGYRQFPPGHIRRLAESPPPTGGAVVLAGDYLVAPTVEGAVRSGLRAADRLVELADGGRREAGPNANGAGTSGSGTPGSGTPGSGTPGSATPG